MRLPTSKQQKTLFDLPRDLRIRSPLCLVAAKVTHGKQMRTGWKENPTSVADRDESRNNILFCTRFENYMENNFANNEAHRDAMRVKIKEINLSKEYWEPPEDDEKCKSRRTYYILGRHLHIRRLIHAGEGNREWSWRDWG